MKIIISSRVFLLISSISIYNTSVYAVNSAPLLQLSDGCHGNDSISVQTGIPTIVDFSKKGFLNSMDVLHRDHRITLVCQKSAEPETGMNGVTGSLGDADFAALAGDFPETPFLPARKDDSQP